MPELPEVQTVCNDLIKAKVIGNKIISVVVKWPRIIQGMKPDEFTKQITQRKIIGVERRGKYIHLLLDKNWHLFIHLRMTGRLNIESPSQEPHAHEHVVLYLNKDRCIKYHDTRKFGRWDLTQQPENIIGHLGVEPLTDDFTAEYLFGLTQKSKKIIKPFLLDQVNIAGVGNIYADESLFLAGIHPETPCYKISFEKIKLLQQAIKDVLNQGIKNLGTTLGTGKTNFYSVSRKKGKNKDRLNVFRREGEKCFVCNTQIIKLVVAQRGTHICPHCQKKPSHKGTNISHRAHRGTEKIKVIKLD
jgi:formamidopyrimidine-DNA glycosylase